MRLLTDSEHRLRLPLRLAVYVVTVLAAAAVVTYGIVGSGATASIVVLATVAAFATAMLVTYVFRRYLDRRPWGDIGMSRPGRRELIGLAAGFVVGVAAIAAWFGIEMAAGWAQVTGWSVTARGALPATLTVVVGALLVMVRAAVEEVAFRGYVFANLAERMPVPIAALVAAAVFALLHLFGGVTSIGYFVAGMAEFMLFACLLTAVRVSTGTLWAAIGIHGGWNWAQDYLLGVGTATESDHGDALLHLRLTGPGWAVGGTGNVDAGLVNFLALAVVAVGVLVLARWRASSGERRASPHLVD
ncbi:CAAX protease family protein [Micromonospora sonchi]|uniref:CAAX protease family protein n=1 Tax=Micromonospora sonchi TaxID=1763543 RepID=A0A917U7M8_9ACTN|nr:CPBP family intramembrane glutamic endopeptidase [Micromonospora sonchi]GGM58296.1 CAAX protease family protein [Micromonospora sonchi]